ncbi:putative NRPS-like protein biosynthetic cluster [Diatrype stigma]|uniref:NRPS-like protein biosynthetic cluster n=1 Tax=Diatrype stigma TaxID=117547 RepID=A0AAN9UNN6_9PEZI
MDHEDLNYFTCTLGQASQWKKRNQPGQQPAQFDTILELLDEQARLFPDKPALGFADFCSQGATDQKRNQVTFNQLRGLSIAAAEALAGIIGSCQCKETQVIGLICMSNLDFVLTLFGFMQLGYTVFLLAPQLDSTAIAHLCHTCHINTIFVDDTAKFRVTQLGGDIRIETIPSYALLPVGFNVDRGFRVRPRTLDIAYVRHTSGTSSGLPKPIFQSHWGAVGVLPRFAGKQSQAATFTTTPLYHGGLADCFRAWTSGAMIWLFPEDHCPITGTNVQRAVRYARENSTCPVQYFSSVPFVLRLLGSDDEGIQLLLSFGIVGVGGAALPAAIGDELVASGVNLVSRMGSAECGFLMSSHRDHRADTEWQYLRAIDDPGLLAFEPRGDGLAELIVKPGWPLRTKTNRSDGSYATSDLFEAHPTVLNAWRYHSRADAQIALANGKKFDPSPVEGAVLASTGMLRDILIVGAGRDYPGALLFVYPGAGSYADMIMALWPCLEKINHNIPSYARLSKSALAIVQTPEGEEPLEKSSKGTILRRQAQERYAEVIESIYRDSDRTFGDRDPETVLDSDLPFRIAAEFSNVLGNKVRLDEDLYRQGVDSMACIQVRRFIENTLLPKSSLPLPVNIIYDCGNINSLASYIKGLRHGDRTRDVEDNGVELSLMWELADRYGSFQRPSPCRGMKSGTVIVLTGGTGVLGAHILHSLLRTPGVRKVYCLTRAQTQLAAQERVLNSLSGRGLAKSQPPEEPTHLDERVVCLPCALSDTNLGLSGDIRKSILEEATLFLHAAWTVNFRLRLSSFDDDLRGTSHLVQFAMRASAQFCFISSTAAVSNTPRGIVPEAISSDPMDSSSLGYARSKWVSERICSSAFDTYSETESAAKGVHKRPPISIIRVGQLCGNEAGFWNISEAYPLMLSTARVAGCLPDFGDMPLSWLRVDLAARAVLEILLPENSKGISQGGSRTSPGVSVLPNVSASSVPVYHVLNPHETPTWNEMLKWVVREAGPPKFDIVQPHEWLQRLEAALERQGQNHPSRSLLGFWKTKYGSERDGSPKDRGLHLQEDVTTGPSFDLTNTSLLSETISHVSPLERKSVLRMWSWIEENVGR